MKKKTLLCLLIACIMMFQTTAQVAINNNGARPDSSAILDIQSTDKGFLPPRMTNTQIDLIVDPAEGLIVYNIDFHQPVFFNGLDWTFFNGTKMLYVGKYFEDGVIFYLDSTGEHGLLCATSDSTIFDSGTGNPTLIYTTWSGAGLGHVGGTSTDIGTGLANTIILVNEYAPYDCAAIWCFDASDPSHPWFLPSRDELLEMFEHRTIINATSVAHGGTPFQSDNYWSSSESSSGRAWYVDFSGYGAADQFIIIEMYARSVRSF